jgi:leucyl aminopeptidase
MQLRFDALSDAASACAETLAVLIEEGPELSGAARALDEISEGAVSRALQAGRCAGKAGQVCELLACPGVSAGRVLLIGAGPASQLTPQVAEDLGAKIISTASKAGSSCLEIRVDHVPASLAAHLAFGAQCGSYRFDKYKTRRAEGDRPPVSEVRVVTADPAPAAKIHTRLDAVGEGMRWARDLVSEPGNLLHPEEFSRRMNDLVKFGVKVEILGEAEMAELGMGALLGVGQGSPRQSQLVVLQWRGASDSSAAPVAIVGKGVTFDAGGLSLKKSEDMPEMKTDMGGAAAVAGLVLALARRKAAVNFVGVLGLVENMPDGNAQRPGDIVTSMSGQTIEIVNTDAEGRLVLADALWYAQQRFHPRVLIDLATLTGVVLYALGPDYAGLCANDEDLAAQLLASGIAERELLWRLPMPRQYDAWHDTPVADMKNYVGHHKAGSIIGALFLQRFVKDTPWAHLDIAGVVWRQKANDWPPQAEGATGFGVRLLDRFVADHFEEKTSG